MPHYLKPHTKEWFAALREVNPIQAAQTEQIIGLAGSSDVCSVCGDKDSHEYQILKMAFGRDVVATIRLCDDCWEIRKGMGEDFVPLSEGRGAEN